MLTGTRPRIVKGSSAVLSWSPIDADGEPAGTDPGVVTIAVTSSDGTEVVAAGTATSGTDTADRTYTLTPTHTAELDYLTATWKVGATTVGTSVVEIVGGVYFQIGELRSIESSVSDPSEWTTSSLVEIRNEVESSFESWTNLSMVPRFSVAKMWTNQGVVVLPDPKLRSVRWLRTSVVASSVTDWSTDQIANIASNDEGVLYLGYGGCWVEVGYEHGLDSPPPDGKRMALLYARICAARTNGTAHNVASFTTPDGQTVTYEPKADPTHYKIINEFLRRPDVDHRTPKVA